MTHHHRDYHQDKGPYLLLDQKVQAQGLTVPVLSLLTSDLYYFLSNLDL